eukprot:6163690-Pleurochrysis_carterae.AAC.6
MDMLRHGKRDDGAGGTDIQLNLARHARQRNFLMFSLCVSFAFRPAASATFATPSAAWTGVSAVQMPRVNKQRCHSRSMTLADRPGQTFWSRRVQLMIAAQLCIPNAAFAAYGDFARIDLNAQMAAGDPSNECLFAVPGSGVCTVYRSSEPPVWTTPDTASAMKKLVNAAANLNGLESDIAASRWTSIAQSLGASRDLREAVGFLTAASKSQNAANAAKKVFRDLDGIALAAQKKNVLAASTSFKQYTQDMPALFKALE